MEDYTSAKEAIFLHTDKRLAPWITVKSNDKKRSRINALRAFPPQLDYADKDPEIVVAPDLKIVARAKSTIGD